MAELQVEGVITDILSVENGKTKAGKEWSKQLFLLKKIASITIYIALKFLEMRKWLI